MTKALSPERREAFAALIYSAAALDFGGLLTAFDKIGLKLKRDDPMEDMQNIRFVLRDTAPPAESRQRFRAFREEQWKKRQQLPRSQRTFSTIAPVPALTLENDGGSLQVASSVFLQLL